MHSTGKKLEPGRKEHRDRLSGNYTFWTKFMAVAYARGCGFEIQLRDGVFTAARDDMPDIQFKLTEKAGVMPGHRPQVYWLRVKISSLYFAGLDHGSN